MLQQLPEHIRAQVIYHLENDNFRAAKLLHDEYLSNKVDFSSNNTAKNTRPQPPRNHTSPFE